MMLAAVIKQDVEGASVARQQRRSIGETRMSSKMLRAPTDGEVQRGLGRTWARAILR
jgi:hypothetical protein